MRTIPVLSLALAIACGGTTVAVETPDVELPSFDQLARLRFNQVALREGVPVHWFVDSDSDNAVDPDEVRSLRFYPTSPTWSENGEFTPAFVAAYSAIVAAAGQDTPSDARLAAVWQELENTAPTLVHNDLRQMPEAHRAFATHMLEVGRQIDALYARQIGGAALATQVASDNASMSLFRRNWGAHCLGAQTESNPACSAVEGATFQPVDVYPAAMQRDDAFCDALSGCQRVVQDPEPPLNIRARRSQRSPSQGTLDNGTVVNSVEQRGDWLRIEEPVAGWIFAPKTAETCIDEAVLAPFTVAREIDGHLSAVPYTEAYAAEMQAISRELIAAANAISADPAETALVAYLNAAAASFLSNDWEPANAAWVGMNATNSKWYIRVAPDEVYWDPCSRKAGFHLSFALIDPGSVVWQERLTPIVADMEGALAELVDTYDARDVGFHMPDFIAIVGNFGDDRDAFGATIGQSLPNWGAVAEAGGRTVVMTNLYTDDDSIARRRLVAASLLTTDSLEMLTDDQESGLMSTILHEATHNLGPAHDYEVNGQTDSEAFGGPLASMLEELKAQSGALFFVEMLRSRGIITDAQAQATYMDSIVWAFGHISRGMWSASGRRRPYSQLAAIQVGYMIDHGVLTWHEDQAPANGEGLGAFSADLSNFPAVARDLMTLVMQIKATVDKDAAIALADQYVGAYTGGGSYASNGADSVVPHEKLVTLYQQFPRSTMVYSIDL